MVNDGREQSARDAMRATESPVRYFASWASHFFHEDVIVRGDPPKLPARAFARSCRSPRVAACISRTIARFAFFVNGARLGSSSITNGTLGVRFAAAVAPLFE